MPTTYKAIATVTVGSGGASSIDFQNIPNTYTDLCVLLSVRSDRNVGGADGLVMEINGVTTNRTYRFIYGDPGTYGVGSSSGTGGFIADITQTLGWTASTFTSISVYVPNYTSSNNKSFSVDSVTENNASTNWNELNAGLWSSTSTIDRLTFKSNNAVNLSQYSTATLYGIKSS